MSELIASFDSREDLYKTAGWLGTIAVMENIGSINTAKTRQLGVKRDHILKLCQEMYANPDTVPQKIQKWTRNKYSQSERVSDFVKTGIITSLEMIDDQFLAAYNIFADTDWRNEPSQATHFDRLLPVTREVTDFHITSANRALGECDNVKQLILDTRHDIDFYIGNYDPSR